MKASQERRKARTAMLGPRPARRYRIAPTFGNGDRIPVGQCRKLVGEAKLSRVRWLRGKRRTVNVACGGVIVATRGRRGRKMYCEHCRVRRAESRRQTREQQRKPWHVSRQPPSSRFGVFRRFSRKTI